jgi:hypothetical protein
MKSNRHLVLALALAGLLMVAWWSVTTPPLKVAADNNAHRSATDRYVSKAGTDSGHCTTVASPCRTIQFAVDAAHSGDRVLVAGGIYTDVHTRSGMTQTAYISKTLSLIADYNNTFTSRDDATILWAQGRGRLFYIADSTPITVTLDGFGLTGGDAKAGGGLTQDGGAILSYGEALHLINVAMTNNQAPDSGAVGGGVFHEFGTLLIEDSEFNLNQAGQSGGGLFVRNADAYVENTHFNKNFADTGGGVDFIRAMAWMTNTIFFENGATYYGSAIDTGGSIARLWHTSLTLDGFNTSAVYVGFDLLPSPSTVYMTNTLAVSHTVAISTASPVNTAVLNGVLWNGNQQNVGGAGTITVTNAYTGNPDFIFEGFTIGAKSEAIGRGVPSAVSRDFSGDLRVGAPDLGADEYVITVFLPLTLRNVGTRNRMY